jgi:hypothetical protein
LLFPEINNFGGLSWYETKKFVKTKLMSVWGSACSFI